MYLIALCDDETAELDKTEKLLSDYEKKHPGTEFMTRRFENADELLWLVREKKYMPNLIFMDIYLPDNGHNSYPLGMEAAKELRNMNYKGKIVFLTTSREHALEAFDVDALQYMVKPVSEEKMFSVLNGLLKDIEEERKKYILLRIEACESGIKRYCMLRSTGKNTMPVSCGRYAVYPADDHDRALRTTLAMSGVCKDRGCLYRQSRIYRQSQCKGDLHGKWNENLSA